MNHAIGQLTLRARRSQAAPPPRTDCQLRLDGRIEWLLEGPARQIQHIRAALPSIAEPLTDTLISLRFGNTVGFFNVPHLGSFEVVSGKWTDRDFDAMLAEICEVASELPFLGSQPGALPFDRTLSMRDPILFHLYAYVRYALSDHAPPDEALIPAFDAILRDPHRKLVSRTERIDLSRCRTIRPSELIGIVSGRYPLVSTSAALAGSAAARALGGRLPVEIDECRADWTVDTPESRFAKLVLEVTIGVLDRMEEFVAVGRRLSPELRLRLQGEVRALRTRLEPSRRHRFWSTLSKLRRIPIDSPVLQRRRGYKATLRFHTQLRLAARVPLHEQDLQKLMSARDIAELYELWCFFRVASELGAWLGPAVEAVAPARDALGASLRWDYRVRWPDGTSLAYNRSFRRSDAGEHRSYSVALRPDIALDLGSGPHAGLHLFDAKFKLTHLGDLFDGDDDPRSTFKRADLHKMHTYRDAIPAARSVWVLYPGTERRWFGVGEEGGLHGVGATPAMPGRANGLVDVLRGC